MREVAANDVGGEVILARMIEEGKAVVYIMNGHQHVRIGEHKWDVTTGMSQLTTIQGQSDDKDTVGDWSIDAIASFFRVLSKMHTNRKTMFWTSATCAS